MKRILILIAAFFVFITHDSFAQTEKQRPPQFAADEKQQTILVALMEAGALMTKLQLQSARPRTDCVMVTLSLVTQAPATAPLGQGIVTLSGGVHDLGIYIEPIGKPNTSSGPRTTQQLIDEGLIIINRPNPNQQVPFEETLPFVEQLLDGQLKMQLMVSRNAKTLHQQTVPIRVVSEGSRNEQLDYLLDVLTEAGAIQPEFNPKDSTKAERPPIPADRRTVPVEELGKDTATATPLKPELCGHKVREFVRREVGEWTRKEKIDSDMSLEKPLRPTAKTDITWTREIRTVYKAKTCTLPKGHAGAHKYGPVVEETDVKIVEETITYWPGDEQVPPKDHWTDRLPR